MVALVSLRLPTKVMSCPETMVAPLASINRWPSMTMLLNVRSSLLPASTVSATLVPVRLETDIEAPAWLAMPTVTVSKPMRVASNCPAVALRAEPVWMNEASEMVAIPEEMTPPATLVMVASSTVKSPELRTAS